MDWRIYYQTNKGRLLAMGGILIVLGLFLYFARGIDARAFRDKTLPPNPNPTCADTASKLKIVH